MKETTPFYKAQPFKIRTLGDSVLTDSFEIAIKKIQKAVMAKLNFLEKLGLNSWKYYFFIGFHWQTFLHNLLL